jgi:hypothetical protein
VTNNDSFRKSASTTSQKFLVNIHYFPFWQIKINGVSYRPTSFDLLGRPIIALKNTDIKNVEVYYQQTLIEMLGNLLTLCSLIFLIVVSLNHQLWKRLSATFN